jgi:hypothetical protein
LIVRHGEACTIRAQNNNASPVAVDLRTVVSRSLLRVTGVDGAARIDNHNVTLSDAALPGKTPGTPSIAPGTPSGGGYLDLATLGATPQVVGDEEALNVPLPTPFKYAGEAWDTIGLTSDGYAVVGGATSQDIQFVPQTLPDPVRPNNVLAPYWTDTTGTNAPGIYAELISDDTSGLNWFVAQWDVKLVTGGATQTFQLWIGLNGTEDIAYAYDPGRPVANPGTSLGLTVGAENLNGSGGAQISGRPTQDLLVTTSGGAPGAKLSYRVGILGLRPGPGRVVTVLSSPAQQGDTVVVSKVKVVPRPG